MHSVLSTLFPKIVLFLKINFSAAVLIAVLPVLLAFCRCSLARNAHGFAYRTHFSLWRMIGGGCAATRYHVPRQRRENADSPIYYFDILSPDEYHCHARPRRSPAVPPRLDVCGFSHTLGLPPRYKYRPVRN